jgi:indolepyruvate ferredoxin oxidoreductase alpha subunit
MRLAYPQAVFPGDIGCYTLGLAQQAVDTCLDMGGAVNLAAGFAASFGQDGNGAPVIASIGDSTFFHAGLPGLQQAVSTNKRFVLVILDNQTTAMTGMQPTPGTGITAQGTANPPLPILNLVQACGVSFVREVDPYQTLQFLGALQEAQAFARGKPGGVAVLIARRECVLMARGKGTFKGAFNPQKLIQNCDGCGTCIGIFGCPAVTLPQGAPAVEVNQALCIRCGACFTACHLIRKKREKGK